MHTKVFRRERGAALVVGMILLLVLTLLAVSGMNTASTELVMAGNEQYQENAFQAAETGIEQAMLNGAFNPGTAIESFPATDVPGTSDTHTVNITPQPQPNFSHGPMWGNSLSSFSTYHFEIESQGQSAVRNATTIHTQGVVQIAPASPGEPPPLLGEPTDLTAP